MKIKNTNLNTAISHALSILIFLLYAINSSGQQEAACKTKLDSYNNLSPFPESKITDYKNCLDMIEKYFYSIEPVVQKNIEQINKLNSELLKSKNHLSSGRATKTDSLNYKALEQTTNTDTKNLTELNKTLSDQKNQYRTSLEKSFKTIIDFYTSIESPDKNIYIQKSESLKAYR